MRTAFVISLAGILLGVAELVIAFWFRALCTA
jgi:hypothetical protein